ncbi:MAG: glycosyltransferase family 2 protein [Acidimicrobiia bacterium]|nr:glycosyltransferase family 2 protein [Acidimicrobiia bacterium]MDH3470466.1 glycosyltransferase family 2 protein [Acidimicrobiia bacterium]
MLRVLALAAQGVLMALILYDLVVSLWGWRQPARSLPGRRDLRFRVVIAAHNEQQAIGTLLNDLAAQDHPANLVRICVVADRCDDDTAAVASASAEVVERTDGPDGKGAALRWYLEGYPLDSDETLVVLDADNRVPLQLLSRFGDELSQERPAVQAYLDVTNPDASWLATASALTYWASNRMVQLARRNLGWSPDLGGTAMAISAAALESAGGFGDSLTEDKDLGARLALAGHKVGWLHDVRVRDEKPETTAVTVRQRARWVAGKRSVSRQHFVPLLGAAIRRASLGLFDQAMRLIHPGRSLVALIAAVMAVVAALIDTSLIFPWPLWAGAALIYFLAPIAFLKRDGVSGRYLVRYPVVVLLAVLWLPIRVMSMGGRGWYHTPHEATSESSLDERPDRP